MAWLNRRRPRLDLGRYKPQELPDDVPLADLIDEAMLIAAAGVRLAVKNLIILRTLRDHVDYDEEAVVEAAREELHSLADEKDADADRLAALRVDVKKRHGMPHHHDDYRFVDTDTLRRREDVSRGLAMRLRELSRDDEHVRAVVTAAHAVAWEEIAASVEQKLIAANQPVDEDYAEYRDDRLLRLLGDLADLEAERAQL